MGICDNCWREMKAETGICARCRIRRASEDAREERDREDADKNRLLEQYEISHSYLDRLCK